MTESDMEIWEWLSSARKKLYSEVATQLSSRALPMSPGLPASKLLVLALSKAILTIVFILWKVFASSFDRLRGESRALGRPRC